MSRTIRTPAAIAALFIAFVAARGDLSGQSAQTGQSQTQAQPSTQSTQDQKQDQKPDQKPTFKAGINYVRVDVIVSDKSGNTVGDLQQGDFDVTEDGKPQTIDSFKLIRLDGGLAESLKEPPRAIRSDYDEEAEAARDDVRLFGI